ncbi:hypothetical protein HOH45_02710, partial [bacterium]|nr:hypothetical protein [bacterium]
MKPKKLIALLVIASVLLVNYALSVPNLISYQGKLTDSSAAPLNGSYTLKFSIYNSSSDGIELWSETYTGASAITLTKGHFFVNLGTITSLNRVIFDTNPLFLGITVESDTEMSPRIALQSVPFAFTASGLEGKAIIDSDNLHIVDNSNLGIHTTSPDGVIQINDASDSSALKIGHTNGTNPHHIVSNRDISFNGYSSSASDSLFSFNSTSSKFDSSSSTPLVTILESGNVGLGTTTPSDKFVVIGSASISSDLTILGSLSGTSADFTGPLTGTTATFSDALSATSGTFSKQLSGTHAILSAGLDAVTG